jgi:hypothetical protein
MRHAIDRLNAYLAPLTGVGGYVAGGYANDVIQNSGFYVPQQ